MPASRAGIIRRDVRDAVCTPQCAQKSKLVALSHDSYNKQLKIRVSPPLLLLSEVRFNGKEHFQYESYILTSPGLDRQAGLLCALSAGLITVISRRQGGPRPLNQLT
ncbi:hypothetical protein BDFG_04162 [Blastomyces dermatitidis ATCC 26199]|nr:hypothetical protein BDFG_04162 [Blastomyces dermatitidis ATCC 26199]